MGTRRRARRRSRPEPSGQHFLRSDRIAAELVSQARVTGDDLVLELGAGTGRLTRPLALVAQRVLAVELDPELASMLRHQFGAAGTVQVVEVDILSVPLPRRPFRAFGNVPFGLGTAILRRLLDDPAGPLLRADLLLQFEVARKRAAAWPSTLASLSWLPWWELTLARRLPRTAFDPAPQVDAGMLSVTRRDPPLLPAVERAAFVALLRTAFRRSSAPVRRSLAGSVGGVHWKRLARERGLAPSSMPRDLDVFDWVDLYRLVRRPGRG